MVKKKDIDWRIEIYDGYLNGATFSLEKFASTATNDHEHCMFCWQKITDLPIENSNIDGYCTVDSKTGQTVWVCKNCFNDFKKQFKFNIK